ncbi:LacI family DNA-binding transcriptional regulator [Liquorilactobacillus satsumensis]|uniref:LacI family DNA-binding transcriptional regulator n=1 Tax=Liquorilactobacillus satsumensis TaxID=259059 RepID=UPI001E457308|nr:LacI family DNA-binding transcriptional regulator [Liquorilactobacillus satsumensis]MCC7667204.1 transcriptional regulator [Liquorilactobacillus satsumensis]
MATISDVARLAGLSVSTVSRVINNNPHVIPKKRKLIEDAMQQLGYVPRPAARQLRGSSTNTMAVTIPRIVNPFFSYLVDAIERTLDEAGYTTIIVQTFSRPEEELTALKMLRNQQVDGVILCSIENPWSVIQPYLQYGRIVLVNEYLADVPVPIIRANQYQGFYNATEFLLQHGYTKLAYATGRKQVALAESGVNFDSDRFSGFQAALNSIGKVRFNSHWLFTNAHTATDGKLILQKIIASPDKPDAILAGSDEVALGLLEEAQAQGVQIPAQLAVLGVDDQPSSSFLKIPLTTIRQPVDQMGSAAAKAMVAALQDQAVTLPQIFPLEIVKRASV